MKKLIHLASKKDFNDGQIMDAVVEGKPVVLCRTVGGFRAVSGMCTHQDWPFSEGYVMGEHIICPLHGAEFDLRLGTCLRLPATRPLETYPLVEKGDELYVEIEQTEMEQEEPAGDQASLYKGETL